MTGAYDSGVTSLDPETRITLDVAGRLFVPQKTRMALDRLTRRKWPDGSPVLWAERRDDRLVTTYAALLAYANDPRTRNQAKILPLDTLEESKPPVVHFPDDWKLGETAPEVLALERTIESLAQENARLRIEIEHLRMRLGQQTGGAVTGHAPR